MKHYQSIEVHAEGQVLTIWLNRVERRNAIDGQMVDDLTHCLSLAADDDAFRVVVLRGRGDYFCAGGDLKWMRSGKDNPVPDRPATRLAGLFAFLFEFPKPVVAVVHGAALGGALGLVSVADFVLADSDAVFSFSELRLGLIPAVISPFVIRKTSPSIARKLMISARKLSAQEALQTQLVDVVAKEADLEKSLAGLCEELVMLAPEAMKACKRMLNKVSESMIGEDLMTYTAGQLHLIQHGDEAGEGVQAFFEKRRPRWNI